VRTNIVLDEKLVAEAMALRGKLRCEGDLDRMRRA